MTTEEQKIFIDKINETILPIAIYLNEDEIRKIIDEVVKTNDNISESFGDMLFEQVIVLKYNRLGK